jgi:hypothetical protein
MDDPEARKGLSDARYFRFMAEGRAALAPPRPRRDDAIAAFQAALLEREGDLQARQLLQLAQRLPRLPR